MAANDEKSGAGLGLGREGIVLACLVEDALLDGARNDVNRTSTPRSCQKRLTGAETNERIAGVVGIGRVRSTQGMTRSSKSRLTETLAGARREGRRCTRSACGRYYRHKRHAVLLPKPTTSEKQATPALREQHVEMGVLQGLSERGKASRQETGIAAGRSAARCDVRQLTRLRMGVVGPTIVTS